MPNSLKLLLFSYYAPKTVAVKFELIHFSKIVDIQLLLLYLDQLIHVECRAWYHGVNHNAKAVSKFLVHCSTEGVAPLHTAPPVPVLRHQCQYCATNAGTAPPVPVLRHQCRYCATMRHQCR
jgi:hypothetical protein